MLLSASRQSARKEHAVPRPRNDISGQTFGRLTAVSYLGREGGFCWECKCSCGSFSRAKSSDLIAGKKQSCGCHNSEICATRNFRHGYAARGSVQPEYRVWLGMRKRCMSPAHKDFKDYGGRGITVCARWNDFNAFLSDMGARPSAQHQIERQDNNGNYEPSNCCWATKQEQMRNRRSRRSVTFQGEKMSLAEASERAGVPYSVVLDRVNKLGWTVEAALEKTAVGRWA